MTSTIGRPSSPSSHPHHRGHEPANNETMGDFIGNSLPNMEPWLWCIVCVILLVLAGGTTTATTTTRSNGGEKWNRWELACCLILSAAACRGVALVVAWNTCKQIDEIVCQINNPNNNEGENKPCIKAATNKENKHPSQLLLLWRLATHKPLKQCSIFGGPDSAGIVMSLVMVPLLCLGVGHSLQHLQQSTKWYGYAISTVISHWTYWETTLLALRQPQPLDGHSMGRVVTTAMLLLVVWMSRHHPSVMVFAGLSHVLYSGMTTHRLPLSFHQVFTQGEWMVVTRLMALALTLYGEVCYYGYNNNEHDNNQKHATVAMAGLVSAVLTCPIMTIIKQMCRRGVTVLRHHSIMFQNNNNNSKKQQPSLSQTQQDSILLILQLPLWVGLPLLGVELLEFGWPNTTVDAMSRPLTTWLTHHRVSPVAVPQALDWLVHFLMETEPPLVLQSFSNWLPQIPRYGWIMYWIVVLAIAIPLSPQPTTTKDTSPSKANAATTTDKIITLLDHKSHVQQVVLARKWFHLIAILLFGPVTVAAPQLLSLSYAIALAILVLLESARSDVPLLQQFHQRYLDPSKDAPDKLVISHMALIVGCAMPLWIAEWVRTSDTTSTTTTTTTTTTATSAHFMLLAQWGVVSLGIGDAMGALVGVLYGKTKWSIDNSRTLEGSLAMWLSMMCTCLLLQYGCKSTLSASFLRQSVVTTTFVTLLEAHTFQIDNLVLPLAGAGLLLLF